jgi:hypothetical protein
MQLKECSLEMLHGILEGTGRRTNPYNTNNTNNTITRITLISLIIRIGMYGRRGLLISCQEDASAQSFIHTSDDLQAAFVAAGAMNPSRETLVLKLYLVDGKDLQWHQHPKLGIRSGDYTRKVRTSLVRLCVCERVRAC